MGNHTIKRKVKYQTDVFSLSFTLSRLSGRCIGKRDRECLYRLAKEAAIIEQNFEAAYHLRQLQNENKPARRS